MGRFKREWPAPIDIARRDQHKDFGNPREAITNAIDTIRARREQRELAGRSLASRALYKMTEQMRHVLHR